MAATHDMASAANFEMAEMSYSSGGGGGSGRTLKELTSHYLNSDANNESAHLASVSNARSQGLVWQYFDTVDNFAQIGEHRYNAQVCVDYQPSDGQIDLIMTSLSDHFSKLSNCAYY